METTSLLIAVLLMLTGMSLIGVAIVRSLHHTWTFGWYEFWVLPVAGLALILLGRWLIR